MPQLMCENLSLGYEGKTVIEGLSFAVHAGDYFCIVGENGSGKSTLMKTLLGLKMPLAGKIVTGDGLSANQIGYMPQQTAAQKDFPASVREVVLSGCLNRSGLRPFYSRAEKQRAQECMESLGISSLFKHCYRELSGGQQQRVLLARALCAAQKILLLDEPVAGLDPKAATELYEVIARLHRGGTTILMISHDLRASLKYATHILHIGGQRALFFGSASEYLRSPVGAHYAASEVAKHD